MEEWQSQCEMESNLLIYERGSANYANLAKLPNAPDILILRKFSMHAHHHQVSSSPTLIWIYKSRYEDN